MARCYVLSEADGETVAWLESCTKRWFVYCFVRESEFVMDYDKIISRIYDHLEEDELEKSVMGCLRLSRNLKDYIATAIFLRELHTDKREIARTLYDDTSHLKVEAQKYLLNLSLERRIEIHTMDFCLPGEDDEERNILCIGVGEIEAEINRLERAIDDMTLPIGMDPFDVAAFTDRIMEGKALIRLRIKALQTIKSRLKAKCLNYAIQVERQLGMQRNSQGFLDEVQTDVNNYFRMRSDDVFAKLRKAAQLVSSRDTEDTSLLLMEVRRALKAAADHFFPPAGVSSPCDFEGRLSRFP